MNEKQREKKESEIQMFQKKKNTNGYLSMKKIQYLYYLVNQGLKYMPRGGFIFGVRVLNSLKSTMIRDQRSINHADNHIRSYQSLHYRSRTIHPM